MRKNDAFVAKNCKYAFDGSFHDHFCPRRKAAKFCHPGSRQSMLDRLRIVLIDLDSQSQ